MKILVTGGTGFIGSHIVKQLVKLKHDVTVCCRKTSPLKFLPLKKIKICHADIRDYAQVKKITSGFDIIYHTAALASDWGRKSDFFKTNVEGTENILKAGFNNGINNFILLSSCAVLGEEDQLSPKDELSPYNPRQSYPLSFLLESNMNYYRISKTLAETEATNFCRDKAVNLTIIRAPWVYGPREFHAGPYIFSKAVQEGYAIMPFNGNKLFHLVYVEDLAKNMASLAEKMPKGTNIFIIADNKPLILKEFLGSFCSALKLKLPYSLPEIFFMPVGIFLEFLYKALKINKSPFLNRARVKIYYCNNVYNNTKAQQLLNLAPQTPVYHAVQKTVRWWRQNGFLR
ncbi:MAG: NAD(P)-dependent oxidoreductase [Candidatus Omnitrophica bacterium]|nr:NAD(P)-dependent oxidoreductase [Candidatus Omnitrophota bacterium]